MRQYHCNGREQSALGFLTGSLTVRDGLLGPVPSGSCRLEVRRRGQRESSFVELPWRQLPAVSREAKAAGKAMPLPAWAPVPDRVLSTPEFPACTFDARRGPFGYVRIPGFSPDDESAGWAQFRQILRAMRGTRGLVVDATNCYGGVTFYGFWLATKLAGRPLALPRFSLRASGMNRESYLELFRETAARSEDSCALAYRRLAREMEGCMKRGEAMTSFGHGFLGGLSTLEPDSEVTYDGPVLILINDQTYSCGEVFASLLKDNGRATLFGTTTGGAGGTFRNVGALPHSGWEVDLTINLIGRPGGEPIENVGVRPDVECAVTALDVAAGYRCYRNSYQSALRAYVSGSVAAVH
jgi:hypothetical protein